MRRTRVLIAALLMGVLAACSAEDPPDILMPDVINLQLDVALSDIERAGVAEEVEVLGGGLFGVVDEANWQVCEQLPVADAVVTEAPRLTVDRACGDATDELTTDEPITDDAVEEVTETQTPESEFSEPSPEDEAESEDPEEHESETSTRIDAQAVEAKFLEHLHNNFIDSINDMCDDGYTHWACFYDGVEDGGSYLQVNLTTDGGWSDGALDEMATDAGRHWFNFIGCDFPDLDTIVLSVNGLDHNVFRWDTQADALCS